MPAGSQRIEVPVAAAIFPAEFFDVLSLLFEESIKSSKDFEFLFFSFEKCSSYKKSAIFFLCFVGLNLEDLNLFEILFFWFINECYISIYNRSKVFIN